MPLPWLIGAAVVAAAAAVVKAVSDDDDNSSSSSSIDEDCLKREQECEAERQRQRQRLETRIANLKKNRLENVRTLLKGSAESLGKPPAVTLGLTVSQVKEALKSTTAASSEYAKSLSSAVSIRGDQATCTRQELKEFSLNLQLLETLSSATTLSETERDDLMSLHKASSRLDRLRQLRNEIKQFG